MKTHYRIPSVQSKRYQSGVVLIVALIILMAMTIISVSSMSSSTLEERMAANLKDREVAFQAAEAALRHGESLVEAGISTGSFNTACSGGYCQHNLQAATTYPIYWEDSTVWSDSAKHITFDAGTSSDAKIIIEYMGTQIQDFSNPDPSTDPPIYRVTALGYGQTVNSRVMLQSTYLRN
ncbi:MAG: PilX N-terminal domain-containing pilus assembly protein [Pseudomonadota bacterium]|nr:PilX N-terminal domain-containing pilus assembly protein [Pseudomonadota bacterium]